MKTELEQLCENYFIELYKINPDLAEVTSYFHYDSDDQAVAPAIVVQAIQGAHRLDGSRGFDVEVTSTYRSTDTGTDTNQAVTGAMKRSIYGAETGMVPEVEGAFGYLEIYDEQMKGGRVTERDLKKRSVIVSLIARTEAS